MNEKYGLDKVAIRMVKMPPLMSKVPINNPKAAVRLICDTLKEFDRETLVVVNFQSDMKPINMNFVSMGTLDTSPAHPREILKTSILSNASSIMLFHNHPSGSLLPSRKDVEVTEMMMRACQIIGIPILDHIIVGTNERYFSFHEKDVLKVPEIEIAHDIDTFSWEESEVAEHQTNFDPRTAAEERKQEMKEITDRLEKGVSEIFQSEKYQKFLDTMAKFPHYSINNNILIMMQKPDATLCQSYTGWKQMGRYVKKGEKGIRILAPAPYKLERLQNKLDDKGKEILDKDGEPVRETVEINVTAFKPVSTFDLSQTEGEPLPTFGVSELTGSVEGYARLFEAIREVSPVPIGFEDIKGEAKGYFHTAENRIAIQEGMSEVQNVKTAIHEMAHAKLHNLEAQKERPDGEQSRPSKEVEAESVAYTVCQHFGIDTSDYSFAYVAGWSHGKEMPELKESLNTIRTAASEMITAIEEKAKELMVEKNQTHDNVQSHDGNDVPNTEKEAGQKKESVMKRLEKKAENKEQDRAAKKNSRSKTKAKSKTKSREESTNLKLVICEKPSVAKSIADVIGATNRKDGYLEGNGYIVSWCFGHLIELAQPQEYDSKYEKWRKEDLPIFPSPFRYDVTEGTRKQFRILKELMDRNDVISLIEATDAGREGELIFRLVYHQAKCKKPFERLWISSMEDTAIREGFKTIRPSSEYDALYEAALCRERADWLVGINATRLFSTLYGQPLNVGRVMTPTLGMIVNREAEINKFRPEPFYTVEIDALGISLSSERIQDKAEAERILSEVTADGNAVITNMKETIKTEKPPLLYDLTSLQRDANKYYGFTAQETLDYTQSLYEKKLVTYPRTDSRYLTDDMGESTRELALSMEDKYGFTKNETIHEERLLNSKKVSDHHAIIPTVNVSDLDMSSLNDGEQKILNIIAARLLSALGDPAEIKEYDLSVTCVGHTFTAKSKVITKPGWKEIENRILGRHSESDDYDDTNAGNSETGNTESCKNSLKNLIRDTPDLLSEGSRISISDSKIKEGMTTPKKRFTESSLLSSMERAGAEETPDEAERKGLGTPATRAGIIEKLVRIGFVERKGDRKTKYLVPTHKGIALITVMPEMIQSPIMTAEWEQKLLGIEKKIFEASEFMKEIQDMITGLIDTYKIVEDTATLMDPDYKPLGKCPCCGSDVIEKPKGFFCSNKSCRFALWRDNRFLDSLSKKMTKEIAVSLLKDGRCRLKKCRSIRTGKTYDTTLVLTTKDDGKAGFILDFDKKKK